MDKKIAVNVTANGSELVVREGVATKPVDPVQVIIVGNIFAPSEFWNKREALIDKNFAHVTIEKGAITLSLGEGNPLGTIVKGILDYSDEYRLLAINEEKRRSISDTLRLLKQLSPYIYDAKSVQRSLTDFSAKRTQSIASNNDRRGNKTSTVVQAVETEIATSAKFNMPIFNVHSAGSFEAEICFDVTDQGIWFWFECPELPIIEENERRGIMKDATACFDEIPVILK